MCKCGITFDLENGGVVHHLSYLPPSRASKGLCVSTVGLHSVRRLRRLRRVRSTRSSHEVVICYKAREKLIWTAHSTPQF